METGVVQYYNQEKGYGFIKSENHFSGIFFHIHDCLEEPIVGNTVEFKIKDSKKRPGTECAYQIKKF